MGVRTNPRWSHSFFFLPFPPFPFPYPANKIFGKVERLASEEAVLQLVLMKCVPILVYGLEVCALDKRSLQSLDFTINRFFMKHFKTSDIKVVKDCQIFYNFELPSALLVKRFDKFIACCAGTDVQFSSDCDPVMISR